MKRIRRIMHKAKHFSELYVLVTITWKVYNSKGEFQEELPVTTHLVPKNVEDFIFDQRIV